MQSRPILKSEATARIHEWGIVQFDAGCSVWTIIFLQFVTYTKIRLRIRIQYPIDHVGLVHEIRMNVYTN
jgi:hypothetical protein